ncbi:ABC transporter ATP-binding protein [bacterium]|nr:ABC transporter ATP-binding protein [candidate division CSSED10-310 bacterium]
MMAPLIDTTDVTREKLDIGLLKALLPRFRPHIRRLLTAALLMAVGSGLTISSPLIVRHAIDQVFPSGNVRQLIAVAGLLLGVIATSFIVNYLQQINLEIVGQNIVRKIRVEVFSHITRLPQAYFSHNPVGTILSRVESDTEAMRRMFTNTVVTLLSDCILVVSIFIVMFVLSWRLAMVLFVMAPLVAWMTIRINRKIVPIFVNARRETAKVYGYLEEYLRGVRVVQAFSQETNVSTGMNEVNRRKFNVEYPGEWLANLFGHSVFFTSTIATILVLGIGGYWSLNRPEFVTMGTLVAFLGYIERFFGPVFHLSEQLNVIQRAFAGIRRIDDVLSMPQETTRIQSELQTGNSASSDPLPAYDPALPPIAEGIEFRNVWFAYTGSDWVLEDVSLVIPRSARYAVVGPTGSGKTTLINLLFRFDHPQRGVIFLDGRDIRTIPLDDLRRRMGLVMQDIVLFPGTVLDNLRLDDETISDIRVLNALETVGAARLVDHSITGLHRELAEHGANLSVGERQLLSFARALVHEPSILVLDEATSSVDPLSEHRIRSAMDTLMQGRTSLVIAHRLQTILDSDCIVVLQNGRIVEKGRHADLLTRRGTYSNLYQIQFGGNGKTV